MEKDLDFLGDSLDRIRALPDGPRREIGYNLDRVQRGLAPADSKPMSRVGSGAFEIRVRDESGAYRVFYVES